MKKFLAFVPAAALRILIAVLIGVILITAVYCIPDDLIRDNITSSAELVYNEGPYPNAYKWCMSELDNFTDGIMLSEACCETEGTALQRAMKSDRYMLYNGWAGIFFYLGISPIQSFDSYARYWHGYLTTLKPLLIITDYSGIRTINLIVQTILVAAVCYFMHKKGLKKYIAPYILSICIIAPLVIAKSLQMSTCYYVFNGGCLGVLLMKDRADFRKYMLVFLWIGIITAYLDFLTYPIATFGMPAVFFLISTDSEDTKKTLLRLLNLLFCWGAGYAVMWASKWILADVILGTNVIANAANEAGIWVDEAKEYYTLWYTIYRNLRSFALNPAMVIALGFAIFLAAKLLKKSGLKELAGKEKLLKLLPFVAVAILPFIWYSAMIAHSYVHDFFTSKALVTTAFALLCLLVKNCSAEKEIYESDN